MEIKKIILQDKFKSFDELWSPKIIGELNGQHIKIAKVKGNFEMHHHEHEDELFMVVTGELFIELKEKTISLKPGEIIIIPRGVDHRPYAHLETQIIMFEPKSTLNTGNLDNEHTKRQLDII